MSIRDIEIFRSVMAGGSTSKAAAVLGISQPAVSQSIRKLEKEAGLRLFERVRGRLVPTQEGIALMAEVDRYFVGYETIVHRIKSLRSFGLGRLSIATFPALGATFLPRVIKAFDAPARGAQISMQMMSSREVHQQVLTGLADFGLLADEMSMSGLEHSTFCQVRAVAVMHPKHRLARSALLTPADFILEDFLALNPEDNARRAVESLLLRHGVTLRPLVETPYSHSVCELAVQGVGIGIVNPLVALDYADRGLTLRPLSFHVPFSAILAQKPGKTLSDTARAFIGLMRVELAKAETALAEKMSSGSSPGEKSTMKGRERRGTART